MLKIKEINDEIRFYILPGAKVKKPEYLKELKEIDNIDISEFREREGVKVIIAPKDHHIWERIDLIAFDLQYSDTYIILDKLFNKTIKFANDIDTFNRLLLLNIAHIYSIYEVSIIEKIANQIIESLNEDTEVSAIESVTVRSADIEEIFGNLKFKVRSWQAHLISLSNKPYIIFLLSIIDKEGNLLENAIIKIELPKDFETKSIALKDLIKEVLEKMWEEIMSKYQLSKEAKFSKGEFEIREVGKVKVEDISDSINKELFIINGESGQIIESREILNNLIRENKLNKLLFLPKEGLNEEGM
ncbi:hypothetical protein [Aquifex sp.]